MAAAPNATAFPPRLVWTFWHEGLASAPPLVRACIDSWRRANPGWEVRVLDSSSLADHPDFAGALDVTRPDLDITKISNLLRLYLLSVFGGVWVDATVYCTRSLDEWLGPYARTGFFAFKDPGPDRRISSWFLAAEPAHPLVREWRRRFAGHFERQRFRLQPTAVGRFVVRQLTPVLGRNARRTQLWLHPRVQRLLQVYPYFLLHYTFNQIVRSDRSHAELWEATPTFAAVIPHRLLHLARRTDGLPPALVHIRSGDAPMYKLSWRVDAHRDYWNAVLQALDVAHSPSVQTDP